VESVEEVLPPKVELFVEQDASDKAKVTVRVTAESSAKDQPVEMLRLLVDGRPLPNNLGVEQLAKPQKKATVTWTIPQLPPGRVELKVMARCPDVSGLSAPRVVQVPAAAAQRPALHVVSVGINYKGKKGLDLDCPVNDAEGISKAFAGACAGNDAFYRLG